MKQFMKYAWMVFVALAFGGTVCRAADVELLQSTIVDNYALNFSSSAATFNRNINGRTYQRFPMATFKGYQYATYYDEERYVCLARRKLPSGAWDVIRFTDYTISSSDSHNVVSVGICEKDGTIHLAFDHHADQLNYRVSVMGAASNPDAVTWSTALFGSVQNQLGSVGTLSGVTYPSFFNAPNGNLMLYYRYGGSGNGDGMIQEYNGTMHDWTTGLGKFISRNGTYNGSLSSNSTSRNPYINGISYAGNRLHATWGWRETSTTAASNHDLNYAYSDDHGRTWRNNAGAIIGVTGSSFIKVNSPGLIVASIPQNIGLSNQYTHYAFPDGSCHVMVAHRDASNNQRSHHYWRNAAGVWSSDDLSINAGRPKLVGDDDGNLFLAYVSGGKPRIAKGVPNAGQTAWSWSLVYTQNVSEDGEGQVDYSRWEADRVLSFYGQEEPANTGETPSPLHVFDYKVSSKAILPVPLHEAGLTNSIASLEWTAGIDATAHRVYLGTNESAVALATPASPEYRGQQSGTAFTPSPALSDYGTYYWRIDEVQAGSVVIPGMVWQFDLIPFGGVATQVVDQGIWDVASTWDPAFVPVVGTEYETSMQLRTPTTSATFGGDLLTVFEGGELALRNTGANTASVPALILDGGQIRAGTGVNVTSTLAGNIQVLSNASLVGYWNATGARNLRIQSRISGIAELRSDASNSDSTHTLYIDNPTNDFSGTWISEVGTIEFAHAGAVGSADIEVLAHGKLTIHGGWDGLASGASLVVADSPDTMVNVGSNEWTVAALTIGSSNVTEGFTYTIAELNAIGMIPVFSGSGTIQVGPPITYLVAGWDIWDSASTPSASVLAPAVTASVVTTTEQNGWNVTDERGASNDGTWGTHERPPSASTITNADFENLTLPNATSGGTITFAVTNNGTTDIVLGNFHFDAYAFRPKAPRTYELSVLTGSDITVGTVYVSADDAITSVSGAWDNGAHDDIDLSLSELADRTLAAGESVQFLLAFSGGEGDDSGGHHLFVDNVGLSAEVPSTESPVLEYSLSGDDMIFTWTDDGFKVQSRTNLTIGIWYDVPGGDTSPVTNSLTYPEEFFRLIEQ